MRIAHYDGDVSHAKYGDQMTNIIAILAMPFLTVTGIYNPPEPSFKTSGCLPAR
jgi:hypothetical protein